MSFLRWSGNKRPVFNNISLPLGVKFPSGVNFVPLGIVHSFVQPMGDRPLMFRRGEQKVFTPETITSTLWDNFTPRGQLHPGFVPGSKSFRTSSCRRSSSDAWISRNWDGPRTPLRWPEIEMKIEIEKIKIEIEIEIENWDENWNWKLRLKLRLKLTLKLRIWPKNISNGHNIPISTISQSRPLQNVPKLWFLVWK
jgi:hypothetical protein